MNNNLDLVVLKTLITNKKYALDFVNEYDSKLFSTEVWNFANIVIGYIKSYKELPTKRVLIDKLSKGNNDKLIEHINKIWDQIENLSYNDKEYKYELEKLKKRFAEKQILSTKDTLSKLDSGSIDISKIVSDLQKTIQSIKSLDKNKTFEIKNIKDYLPTFVEKFNARKNNPTIDCGLKTQYSFIDFATNGLRPADFMIVAGESGFGKSLLLKNIAIQTWLQADSISNKIELTNGKNIIYFSLEMPYEDCFNRLISRLSGVPSRAIENAQLSREDFEKVKVCLDFIDKYPYKFKIVDITEACANDIESILLESGEEYDAIFIDYLGIMKTNDKTDDQDWLKQGIIAFETRAIARKYKVPMFSAVQLNRKAASGKSKDSSDNIGLSRLARSGTIATHATHVIQIENRDNEENRSDFIYHIIKNRKGPKGKGSLIKNLSCATLIDILERNESVENTDANQYDNYFKDQDDISEKIEDLEL